MYTEEEFFQETLNCNTSNKSEGEKRERNNTRKKKTQSVPDAFSTNTSQTCFSSTRNAK